MMPKLCWHSVDIPSQYLLSLFIMTTGCSKASFIVPNIKFLIISAIAYSECSAAQKSSMYDFEFLVYNENVVTISCFHTF